MIYQTMLTKDYIPDWSVSNGIREFVANALDSDYPFEYEIGSDYINLTSVGVTLPAKILTLGTSENRNKSFAVGKHGEGVLIGIIPILRNGHSICFQNGPKLWQPEFRYSESFERDVLVIEEVEIYNDGNFTVQISGLNPEIIDGVIHDCLYLQKDLGEVREGTGGRVLLDRPGKLYVGGLYVCDINGHKFGYDFLPQYLPLNRDRKSVEGWELAKNAGLLLAEVFPAEEVAELIETRSADVNYAEYHAHNSSNSSAVYDACYKRLVEKHGDDVVITKDWDEKEKLEKRGFENVVVVSSDTHYTYVVRSPLYQERFSELEEEALEEEEEDNRSPVELLEDWYNGAGIGTQHALEELIDIFKERGVIWGD